MTVLPDSMPYFNRDLSWLKFNERVLHQAMDSRVPLLERVRFLGIFSTNLDEFFMKRIGPLKRNEGRNIPQIGTDTVPAKQLMEQVRETINKHVAMRRQCYEKHLLPDLGKQKIQFVKWADLIDEEKTRMKEYFLAKVFPLLTPLAVDKSHPFPFLSNLSLSLGVILARPKNAETPLFARIKIPDTLPQWVQIHMSGEKGYRLMRLIDLISANLEELFPEMIIQNVMPFRVTRNAEIQENIEDEEVEDQLDLVEEELRLRRVAQIVRLEYSSVPDMSMLKFLRDELELSDTDLFEIPGEISYSSMFEIANLNIPQLRYKVHTPIKPLALREDDDIFAIIKKKDVLMHSPYESFTDSVERFIREAVDDPNVLAIKITLYRAGENNPIIPLLITAAEHGKQVVCVVELKARFDEARNIAWGEMLENAGVHVVYGVLGKKIHCKTILVIRKEGEAYSFYSHIGTGNYNPHTAKLYTDLNLFTADKRIGGELIEVFNFLTGLSLKKNYQKIMVAPVNMRRRITQYIKKEIEHQKNGEGGYILAKMNSLEDKEMCDLLYQASQAGVKIDLVVRGFCCLKPGVPGLSENIRVLSVIGRFLEHSRIFYFKRGAKEPTDGRFYIGSADWMYRNLNNRIEILVPVEEAGARAYLWQVLQKTLNDRVQVWDLQPTGDYALRKSENNEERGVQEELIKMHEV